jgi:hypothetical protein
MMQQLNKSHPDDYLLAMRVLWAPIGLMIIFWIFVPESPWFHARNGDKPAAMKSLKQLYGNVQGYDFEEEYSIIERTIIHERDTLQHKPTYLDVFRGLDRVSTECKLDLTFRNVLFRSCYSLLADSLEDFQSSAPTQLVSSRYLSNTSLACPDGRFLLTCRPRRSVLGKFDSLVSQQTLPITRQH